VRIAFFLDPDGARLEFIQGNLRYQTVASRRLADAERATRMAPGDGPRFDHVAVTVPDLTAARRFWCDRMGCEVIGQIRHHGDPRGFLMTYLQAGSAVLEVFSFDVPTAPNARGREPSLLGFRGVGMSVPDAGRAAGADAGRFEATGGTGAVLDPGGVRVESGRTGTRSSAGPAGEAR
jgi:catechol 2,3-dioxygenase-like lactoylglutathione lyase family enzyme